MLVQFNLTVSSWVSFKGQGHG